MPIDFFPYKPWFNQKEAMNKIYEYIKDNQNVLFHAPTGFGKTPVVLAAVLPIALDEGLKIIWAVRTGNETDRPVEELLNINRHLKEYIFGFSLRGKRDMCLLAREKLITDHESVAILCRKIKNKCPYYLNLKENYIYINKPLLFSEILELARTKRICPYYLQLNMLEEATLVSLSYNYVLSKPLSWTLRSRFSLDNSILVIDEAHNIPKAVSSLNSDRISTETVKRALKEVVSFVGTRDIANKLVKLGKIMKEEGEKIKGEDDVFSPLDIYEEVGFDDNDYKLMANIVSRIYAEQLRVGTPPRSSLRHIATFFQKLIDSVNIRGIAYLKYLEKDRVYFEIWDMRSSETLTEIWDNFSNVLFMSGTLKPYKAFADVVGINNYGIVEGYFPIPKENVRAIITKGVSTKGEDLSKNMQRKYERLLEAITRQINKNTAYFFSSYRIMSKLLRKLKELSQEVGRPLFIEYEGMPGDKARSILNKFKSTSNGILAATMQGRFAEGADFPGETLEAIVLIGIPFDRLTKRTILFISYYTEIFGKRRGRFYAYVVPAIRRAAQAMGRAIRSPEDKAIIIAADERYHKKQYLSLLPEFFRQNIKLLSVSSTKWESELR
ncbi:MAG: ATP-dependent DNA helicase [Candidatus Njordarchaeales archaeon]